MKKNELEQYLVSLMEFFLRFPRSELKLVYREIVDEYEKVNPNKINKLNDALSHVGLSWLTRSLEAPDDKDYRAYGIPQDIIMEGK